MTAGRPTTRTRVVGMRSAIFTTCASRPSVRRRISKPGARQLQGPLAGDETGRRASPSQVRRRCLSLPTPPPRLPRTLPCLARHWTGGPSPCLFAAQASAGDFGNPRRAISSNGSRSAMRPVLRFSSTISRFPSTERSYRICAPSKCTRRSPAVSAAILARQRFPASQLFGDPPQAGAAAAPALQTVFSGRLVYPAFA